MRRWLLLLVLLWLAAPVLALGTFTQTVTIDVTVSGVKYRWTGPATFTPEGSEVRRAISGVGDFLPVSTVPLSITGLTIAPASVAAGQSAQLTVTLNRSPDAAVQIPLTSSLPSVATVPASITLQPGQTSGTVAVLAGQVTVTQTAALVAAWNGQSKSVNLIVTALPTPPVLALSYLSMGPPAVLSGQGATVTVVLTRAPGATLIVALKSSDTTVATVPSAVTFAPNQVSATAAVSTLSVTTTKMVSIIATLGGQSKNANLQVNPVVVVTPPPPPGDGPHVKGYTRLGNMPIEPLPVPKGTTLEIRGERFGSGNGTLLLNSQPFNYELWTDTIISARLADPDVFPTPSYFTVKRPDGKETSAMAFVNEPGLMPPPPTLTRVQDAAGATITRAAPGDLVTLVGTNFGSMGLVFFKAVPQVCQIVDWSAQSARIYVPYAWDQEKTGPIELFQGQEGKPGMLSGFTATLPSFTIRGPLP